MSGAVDLDEDYLNIVWSHVSALKESIVEAESNANVVPAANPWKTMSPEVKRSTALMAVETLLLRQFKAFVEVKIILSINF